MTAVPKPEILPFPAPEPGEPEFLTEDRMFQPPEWGKYTHSEADLRRMWSRIWRCFKSRRLCEGFIQFNRVHSLEVWCAAFEHVRQSKEKMDYILYVKKVADDYSINGTPAQIAARELAEAEAAAGKLRNAGKYVVVDPDSPDVKALEKRKAAPQSTEENNPMVLKYQKMLRGKK